MTNALKGRRLDDRGRSCSNSFSAAVNVEISFAVGKILLRRLKMPSRILLCIVVLTFVLQQKAWSPKLSMICPQEHIVTSSSGQSSSRLFQNYLVFGGAQCPFCSFPGVIWTCSVGGFLSVSFW